jgi:predicted permease
MSVALLVGAGLFVRSLNRVRDMRLGYDTNRVVLVRHDLRGTTLSDSEAVALRRRMLRTIEELPQVERAAVVSSIPFWSTSSTRLFVAGIDSVQRLGRFTYQQGTPDYFATMGTRILRGRAFGPEDRAGAPRVAVVSEGMANALWPGKDALGQCMRVAADTMPCTTVIGIAEDAVQQSLTDPERFRYYLPLDQFRPLSGSFLMVRTRGEPSVQAESIRLALQRLMPGQAYVTAWPLDEVVGGQRRSWEIGAAMFVAFGGLALVVAAIGLYAVIGYNVAQRMHELGVRIALGARSADVIRLVVGQGMGFAIAGALLGSALAFMAARWVQPLLFQQSARDPLVFTSVAGLLILVAIVAGVPSDPRRSEPDASGRIGTIGGLKASVQPSEAIACQAIRRLAHFVQPCVGVDQAEAQHRAPAHLGRCHHGVAVSSKALDGSFHAGVGFGRADARQAGREGDDGELRRSHNVPARVATKHPFHFFSQRDPAIDRVAIRRQPEDAQ